MSCAIQVNLFFQLTFVILSSPRNFQYNVFLNLGRPRKLQKSKKKTNKKPTTAVPSLLSNFSPLSFKKLLLNYIFIYHPNQKVNSQPDFYFTFAEDYLLSVQLPNQNFIIQVLFSEQLQVKIGKKIKMARKEAKVHKQQEKDKNLYSLEDTLTMFANFFPLFKRPLKIFF